MTSDAELIEAAREGLNAALGTAARDGQLNLDPETVQQDLARLVLGLMEFLRKLMELQAIRRMEAGSLTDEEADRVGETLMKAEQALEEVAAQFGLAPEDLSLNLGPLGRLT